MNSTARGVARCGYTPFFVCRGVRTKSWIGQGVDHQGQAYKLTAEVVSSYYPFTHYGSGLVLLDQGDELLLWNDTVRVLGGYFPVHSFEGGSPRFEHMKEALKLIREHVKD